MTRVPSCLAEDVAKVSVARSRAAAFRFAVPAGIFGGNESGVAHHLRRTAKSLERPDLGHDGDCGQLGYAAKGLESFNHGAHVRRRRQDKAVDGFVQMIESLAHVQHFGDAIGERDLLSLVVELKGLHPTPPRMRPCAAFVRGTQTATKQVLDQTVLGATLVGFRGPSLAHEIAKSLVLGAWEPRRA